MPFANNNGVRIHYEVEGSGPPLVLHHGLNYSLESWRIAGYLEPLKRDYRLVLVDSRGHGASDKPHKVSAYALPLRVADVLAVLDDLRIEKAHYLGYSMGGWVGWGIARYAPERFCSLIIGGYSASAHLSEGLVRRLYADMEGFLAVSLQYRGPWGAPDDERILAANDLDALRAAATLLVEELEMGQILPTVTVPCLLFGGDQDNLFAGAEECARLMPRATLLSLPGIGHLDALFRTDLVLPHIRRFLASVKASVSRAI